MRRISLLFVLLCAFPATSQSLQQLYAESKKAYESKDYVSFLKQNIKLDSLRPSHPAFTYNLAVAYAMNSNENQSLKVLKKAVLMNNEIEFETAEDFESLIELQGFKDLIQLKTDLNIPVMTSAKVLSLSEKDLHTEGVLYLKKSKKWLATSIRKHKIIEFDSAGKCSDWLKSDDILAVFSMKADSKEKYLWVATSAMPEMQGFTKESDGKAEILKVEISSRKIIQRFKIEGKHVFGDLAIAKNGDVYITDSANAMVYRIKDNKMQTWLHLEKEAFNLQGITFNNDFSQLYIADYLKGILSIQISKPQNRNWLQFPESTTTKGIDGLVFYKNSLIAVHNGVTPIRIVRYFLNDKSEIADYKILDHNRPVFNEPALATIKGNELYFFANSPWKAYDKSFTLDVSKFENPMLFKAVLD